MPILLARGAVLGDPRRVLIPQTLKCRAFPQLRPGQLALAKALVDEEALEGLLLVRREEEALEGLLLVRREERKYFPRQWVWDSNIIQTLIPKGKA